MQGAHLEKSLVFYPVFSSWVSNIKSVLNSSNPKIKEKGEKITANFKPCS
jgi:hypothetical protein